MGAKNKMRLPWEGRLAMADKTFLETTKVQGDKLLETVKGLVHEGNVRRIIIKQGDRSVAEFPLTAGVVGAVFTRCWPPLARWRR